MNHEALLTLYGILTENWATEAQRANQAEKQLEELNEITKQHQAYMIELEKEIEQLKKEKADLLSELDPFGTESGLSPDSIQDHPADLTG